MSNNNEESGMNDNIIKLKVSGSKRVVNTIEDQKTARGMSLVCPFPALEVDIPIKFTNSEGEACEGSIHRIGVEDDPETGLPKLRLSVRNEKDDRETVISTPSDTLIAEASGLIPVPEVVAQAKIEEVPVEASVEEVNVDSPMQAEEIDVSSFAIDEDDSAENVDTTLSGEIDVNDASLLDGLFDELVDTNTSELLSLDEIDAMKQGNSKDPDWVCYADMPIPGELLERAQTRRRRRAIAVAAWMMVLGIAAGGVFVLGKAGVVDLSSAQKYMSGITDTQEADATQNTLEELSSIEEQVVGNVVDANVQHAAQQDAAPQIEAVAAAAQEDVIESEDTDEESSMIESAAEQVAAAVADATEIVLPTRWPAEFATAYRLQNPNGVVVDVPGGLVKKEGWMTLKEGDEIIRSIKAVQRENGARFIVYVNGNLPNFKTTPKSGGIRLSLYYDAQEQTSSETQEVAMLEE